jgi:predicted alpha/beta hydrolase
MDIASLRTYLGVCAVCLARAHARTGDEISIYGYIGKKDTFANAIADFAVSYADQTERDYQALVDAVESGRVEAQTGI